MPGFIFLIFCYAIYLLAFLFFAAVFFVAISVLLGRGAVYVPADRKIVRKMIELAEVKSGDRAVDLGSGDGRIVVALARAGAEAHGYEINPILVWIARRNIQKAGLGKKAFVHWKSFWGKNLGSFDVIIIYGVSYIMKKLENKIKKESLPGTRVVSYVFPFPNWKFSQKEKAIYLYLKK